MMRRMISLLLITTVWLPLACVTARAQTSLKTHIVDVLHDASGNPLTGKVTFILTQKSASSPDGLVVASPTVSATLDPTGKFDVWLYPSVSLSPVSYYQVYATSGAGSQTFLGVYNIPSVSPSSVVTLAPYKVVDTNLAAQYTFASSASVQALSATISQATYKALLGALGDSKIQKFSSATQTLSDSALSETPTQVVSTKQVSAPSFVGNGAGLTGIASGTGGISNTGSTSLIADADADGVGVIDMQIAGVSALRINNDRSLTFGGDVLLPASSILPFSSNPAKWMQRDHPSNPITPVTASGDRQFENYDPSPAKITVGNAEWLYNKGGTQIHAYKSTDNGATWSYQCAALSPGAAGQWDQTVVVEPFVIFDQANNVIHMWYKGRNASNVDQAGHATASPSDPCTFTKDAANPVITAAQAQAATGIPTVRQLAITEGVKIGSAWTFYFYASDGNVSTIPTVTKVAYATSSSLSAVPTVQTTVTGLPTGGKRVVILFSEFMQPGSNYKTALVRESTPTIDANPQSWGAIFTYTTTDGVSFTPDPGNLFIQPTGGASGWKARMTHSARILKDPADASNLKPLLVNGEYQIFYSGIDATGALSQGGLMYVTPGAGRTPQLVAQAAASSIPAYWFKNTLGSIADAAISADSSSSGTELFLGSNWYKAVGTYPRWDSSLVGLALQLKPDDGSINLLSWPAGGSSAVVTMLSLTPSAAKFGEDVGVTDSTKGLILKSPGGTCYRVQAANGGTLTLSSVTCP